MILEANKFRDLMQTCKKVIDDNKNTLSVTSKEANDFVTNVDLSLEAAIIAFIRKHFPEDVIISEEGVHQPLTDQPTWVIDPLDGTNNFVYGSKVYGIQFGRIINRKCVFAVLYMPETDDFYIAEKGKGAFRNGEKLTARLEQPVAQSIFSFGGFSKSSPESRVYELKVLDFYKDKCMGVRIFGSSCMDFSALASGQTHMHLMFSKRIWEVEAGLLLLRESGVQVKRICIPNTDVVAICGAHNPSVLERVKSLLLND